jgi:hypothetical protein
MANLTKKLKSVIIGIGMIMATGCLKPDSKSSESEAMTSLLVSGKVVFANGTPASGVKVYTNASVDSDIQTESSGKFDLVLQAPELASLSTVSGQSQTSFYVFFEASDGTNLRGVSEAISTSSRGVIKVDTVKIQTPASVEGKVLILRDDGQIAIPTAGVKLRIGSKDLTTGTEGNFAVSDIPAGYVPVYGYIDGSAPLRDTWQILPGETKKFEVPFLLFPEKGVHGLVMPDQNATKPSALTTKTPYTKAFSVRHSPNAVSFRYHHVREKLEKSEIEWKPIDQKIEYDFGANGGHTLYYQFSDQTNQTISQLYSLQAIIDPLGDSNGFVVNDGSGITNNLDVTLNIDVPPTAFRMRVAESMEDLKKVEWNIPQSVFNYRLRARPDLDIGSRTIYVQFGDVGGLLSPVFTSNITVFLWPAPIPDVFVINNGDTESRSRLVKLDIKVPTQAYEMQIFEAQEDRQSFGQTNVFIDSSITSTATNTKELWLAAKPEFYFKFSGSGMKILYLQFRTRDSSISPLYDQKIRVLPFSNNADGFVINNNAPISRSRHLELNLIPPYGSIQFRAAETGIGLNQAPWLSIVPNFLFSVASAGVKTIYLEYRNIDGDESAVFAQSINVDPFPLGGNDFVINGGDPITLSPQLHIDLLPTIPATHFMIGEGQAPNLGNEEWLEIRPDIAFTVYGTGSKLIYVRYRSDDGVVSAAIQKTIFYDPFPFGSAGIEINNGSATTTNAQVSLKIFGEVNLTAMRISNDIGTINSMPFIQYQSELNHLIPDTLGLHKVYVQFRTANGEISPVYFSEITKN